MKIILAELEEIFAIKYLFLALKVRNKNLIIQELVMQVKRFLGLLGLGDYLRSIAISETSTKHLFI